ncbi:MAG: L-histidine N(alpha)-methyltransferase [Bryobacteraceae bacterium]|nr:L-histidine N(alpha)-methyltransferase [Bryobacteraceae bacterium]
MIIAPIAHSCSSDFASEVAAGLTMNPQKELPSKYLYDQLGSRLFDAICELPEYGLTRADERLLRKHAGEIAAQVPQDVLVCELGSGSGGKTRWILEALTRHRKISYFPIEISPMALTLCQRELSDIESLAIVGLEREYLDGLRHVAERRHADQAMLVLFLGSTIGNFSDPADVAFLRQVRGMLRPGDFLLLGADLQKPLANLIPAYDDALGVTAAFNLNLLSRVNRELGANFDLNAFRHEARFNAETSSIEMHLRSVRPQSVTVASAGLAVEFSEGETIWTENSHKYSLIELKQKALVAGFQVHVQWIDTEWQFAENLLVAAGEPVG